METATKLYMEMERERDSQVYFTASAGNTSLVQIENVEKAGDLRTEPVIVTVTDTMPQSEEVISSSNQPVSMVKLSKVSDAGISDVSDPYVTAGVDADSVTVVVPGSADIETLGQACLVCGDRGSGFHYSVFSCEGCKGFFKRTVQKNLQYTCKDTGNCMINKMSRNSCQHCRFRKCLLTGMKREAVREDRSPGGKHRQKRPRLEETAIPVDDDILNQQKKLDEGHQDLIRKIVEASPEKVPKPDGAIQAAMQGDLDTSQLTLQGMMQLGYAELRMIIEWAKKVPGFREFDLADQMAMLKSAFMDLNVLRVSYRSVSYPGMVFFAEGLLLPASLGATVGWGEEVINSTVDFTDKMRELELDQTEFCFMNAIVLTYPDAIGVADKQKVTSLQTKFLDCLRRYITHTYRQDKGRFGKILLRLPTLRTVSAKVAEKFLSLTVEGVLTMDELVQEMYN